MKKIIHISTLFCIMAMLCFTNIPFAFASEIDVNEQGSITIEYEEDIISHEIGFKVYQITSLDEKGMQNFLPEYENFAEKYNINFEDVKDNSSWQYFSDNLENYINYKDKSPDYVSVTDDNGKYTLEGLELGIYFIQFDPCTHTEHTIYTKPSLITVGTQDPVTGQFVCDSMINPKVSVISSDEQNLTVKKVWENTNSELLIADEIEIELYCDGEVFDTVTLSKENNWTATWYDIDVEKTWAVKEITKFENFDVSYEKDIFEFTVTNTYTDVPDEELPQTGSYAYLIPIFSGIGLIFILLGVLIRKVKYD